MLEYGAEETQYDRAMFPELLQLGPFTLKSFGLMAALGFLAAYCAMRRFAVRLSGLSPDDASGLLVAAMAGGALGARAAYVAEHWSAEFAGGPLLEVLRFDRGGLMFYGGLGGAIVVIAILALVWRRPVTALLDLAALALPLGHAFGRVGCFLNGCCFGRTSSCFLSVTYPAGSAPWMEHVGAGLVARSAARSLPVIPVQLFEAALDLALFAALARLASRGPRRGAVSGAYLVCYAVIRFLTEALRDDPRMAVGPLSISQFICVFVLLAGFAFLAASRRLPPAWTPPAPLGEGK